MIKSFCTYITIFPMIKELKKCCFMIIGKRILKTELYYVEYWIIKKFINYEIEAKYTKLLFRSVQDLEFQYFWNAML